MTRDEQYGDLLADLHARAVAHDEAGEAGALVAFVDIRFDGIAADTLAARSPAALFAAARQQFELLPGCGGTASSGSRWSR